MPNPGRAARTTAVLALLLFACTDEPPPTAPVDDRAATATDEVRRRGLWVLCEGSQRVLEHPERLDRLFSHAEQLAATDLFVQVYRGGRAWFDSTRADASPYREMAAAQGTDPLRVLLQRAQEAGLRVHAWVNVLSLAGRRDAPILDAVGRDGVLVDQHGRSVLDYPELDVPPPDRRYYRMGTPAVWLDAGAPGVADYLVSTFAELVANYPELDGLHLDYIRYPGVLPFSPGSRFGVGLEFGYGAKTRARFRAETGLEAPYGDSTRNANRWDEWRRDQVTQLVAAIAETARAAKPGIVMSAAVGSYVERVYLSEGQDWQRWLEDGSIDLAVPMVYSLDDRMFRYMAERFSNGPLSDRIWLGQGTWLFAKRPEGALAQLATARAAGATGEVLFSYDSIADAPELLASLIADAAGADGGASDGG